MTAPSRRARKPRPPEAPASSEAASLGNLERPSQSPVDPRLIAIGDVHGCADQLRVLLDALRLRPADTLVMLGDYVDRGPDSRGVIEMLMAARRRCRVVTLRGNHEQMMLDARQSSAAMGLWIMNGGDATLDSYGASTWDDIPADHLAFLGETLLFHEEDDAIFVHANYTEHLPLAGQDPDVLLWRHLHVAMPGPHHSGKTAYLGHTLMLDEPFDAGHFVCLDTGCFAGGTLTALDVRTRECWQAGTDGRLRHHPAPAPG